MNELILQWAMERNILNPENAFKQLAKLQEECGELAGAMLKSDSAKIIDSIGDIQVVMIILSAQLGYDYKSCLEIAYNEIKDRKGKTIDGTFVRE